MHEYRYVEYLDDGHHSYQCLTCKQYLPAAGNYCMQCGVKFTGEAHCRPRDCPAWAWRVWGGAWQPHYYDYLASHRHKDRLSQWRLERRRLACGKVVDDWEQQQYSTNDTAFGFYDMVRDMLTGSIFESWVYEYRFLLVTASSTRVSPVFRREYQPLD